jgi:uncharacterized protein (TIRG00374 family)
MPRFELGATFFVTNVLNRLVSSGGVAGLSLRYLMMKPHGVTLNDVLNSSFIHFFLGSLVMLGMLPLVTVYVIATLPVSAATELDLIFAAVAGAILFLGIVTILFNDRQRWKVARLAVWLGKKLARRDLTVPVERYMRRAAWAVATLRHDWKAFSAVMLLFAAELAANVVVLGYCLKAFGPGLSFAGTAVIYMVAMIAGFISALPGGIGVQEAMITSLAVLQGSSFAQAALAAILYRILQTILPYLVSLGFYPQLLKAPTSKGESTGDRI